MRTKQLHAKFIVLSYCLLNMAAAILLGAVLAQPTFARPIPDKTVVLTFDDAVRSHLTVAAPLLKKYGFGATFFVTPCWFKDTENFLTWEEIGELHKMGFEIGNHSWTHNGFGTPKAAAHLAGELALVERALEAVGVPKPVSFAWPCNAFGPEALLALKARGYQFARRGMEPEVAYAQIKPGPLYDPDAHHPLLIPTSGDAYPEWTLDALKAVVEHARNGKIAVLQFHGVPDKAHPWVHTPPERFREYMSYLKQEGFNVIAVRDLADFVDLSLQRNDPMTAVRFSNAPLELPAEVAATRADLPFWLENIITHHRYSMEEAAKACAYPVSLLKRKITELDLSLGPAPPRTAGRPLKVLPYPGGRHPRTGNLEAAISPLRGTKASIFSPWENGGYVVLDLPEAIFSNLGLIFLAHTDIPSVWDEANITIDNTDWKRLPSGTLESEWMLPNRIRFGGRVEPRAGCADIKLWLENGTDKPITKLRAQVCVMLKGLTGFNKQGNAGRLYQNGVAAARSEDDKRWVLVAFERCSRTWGHPLVPCIHSDPLLPDVAPGKRVCVRGQLWFYEGDDIQGEIAKAAKRYIGYKIR